MNLNTQRRKKISKEIQNLFSLPLYETLVSENSNFYLSRLYIFFVYTIGSIESIA